MKELVQHYKMETRLGGVSDWPKRELVNEIIKKETICKEKTLSGSPSYYFVARAS